MRRISTFALAFVLAFGGLGACSSGDSAAKRADMKAADAAAIANLEAIIHGAQSTKDIEAMMKPFAEDAIFTLGGQTHTGKEAIRKFVLSTGPFKPENRWISVTPAYKIRTSTDGKRGTLYFECHYVDVDSKLVKAAVSVDVKASKVDGQWILTNVTAAPAVLS